MMRPRIYERAMLIEVSSTLDLGIRVYIKHTIVNLRIRTPQIKYII
jgi:hypothetical protein